jgi:hypothetical protein
VGNAEEVLNQVTCPSFDLPVWVIAMEKFNLFGNKGGKDVSFQQADPSQNVHVQSKLAESWMNPGNIYHVCLTSCMQILHEILYQCSVHTSVSKKLNKNFYWLKEKRGASFILASGDVHRGFIVTSTAWANILNSGVNLWQLPVSTTKVWDQLQHPHAKHS